MNKQKNTIFWRNICLAALFGFQNKSAKLILGMCRLVLVGSNE
jgi:hypothetical protein